MDVAQLQQAYAELDQYVQALENLPVTLESLQADYAALTLRVDALAPQMLFSVSQSDFNLLGGWKLDSRCGFAGNGLYVERYGDDLKLFMSSLNPSVPQEYSAKLSNASSYPLASWVRSHNPSHPETGCPYFVSRGLCRPNGGKLLSSSISTYATDSQSQNGKFLTWIDSANVPCSVQPSQRQVFGGGFVDIPRWFADAHLGGNDFGLALGGYHSGQTSTAGHSLLVTPRPSDLDTTLGQSKTLLRFGNFSSLNKSEIEQRPGDYNDTTGWVPQPDNGVGYFGSSEVMDAFWIDTPQLSTLCFMTIQGTGQLEYALQDTCFSRVRVPRLYCYSPRDLAEVANETKEPHELRGTYSDWYGPYSPKFPSDHHKWPIGAHWDGKYLYVAYREATGSYDYAPIICLYELK